MAALIPNQPNALYLEDMPGGPPAGTCLVLVEALAQAGLLSLRLAAPGHTLALIAVMTPAGPRVYENRCPHAGTPLDALGGPLWAPGQRWLRCGTHGALFDPATGQCRRGPCRGDALRRVAIAVQAGQVLSA